MDCVFKNAGFPLVDCFVPHPYDDEGQSFGGNMGRRGSVKRMAALLHRATHGERRTHAGCVAPGQDHFTRLTELIRQELDDETQLVEERWKTWSKQRLLLAGVSLFDLKARPQGRFFGEDIIVFEAQDGGVCPNIDFPGDIVLISRSRPWGEKVVEGVVLDRGPRVFELSLASGPGTSEKGVGVSTEGRTV